MDLDIIKWAARLLIGVSMLLCARTHWYGHMRGLIDPCREPASELRPC